MPEILNDCRKEFCGAEWFMHPKKNPAREKETREGMWDHASREIIRNDKKCVIRWAANVRAQYEPAKRVIRFFRWHYRPHFHNAAQRLFYEEAARWKDDTMHWSSVTKMIAHPSYLRIIGLGREFEDGEIEGLILRELRDEPDHWFEALVAITGENPVRPGDDFDGAVAAWLEWGRQKGLVHH